MNQAKTEEWIVDVKDGEATLVYNENDDRADAVIRVFGEDQQQTAERIVRLLNADNAGLPTYSELVATLGHLRNQAKLSDLPDNNGAMLHADELLARAGWGWDA